VAVLAEAGVKAGELLAGPLRAGGRAVDVVERFAAQVRIVDLSPPIARLAAELRAVRGLKLPDAVIVATGLRLQADVIVTADARWKGIETVKVVDGRR
jgi:predicted nucleic acid-binding protein